MSARLFEGLSSARPRVVRAQHRWPISVALHLLAVGALVLLSNPPPQDSTEPRPPQGPLSLQIVRAAERAPRAPAPLRARTRAALPTSASPALAPALTQAAPTTVPTDLPSADSGATEPALPFGDGCPQGGCVPGGSGHASAPGWDAGVPDGPGGGVPFVAGRDVTAPAKLHDVAPVYPVLAQRARISGAVVVVCTIDVRGLVVDARAVSGPPLLSAAALTAVRQWRYRPTLVGGQPVAVMLTVTVNFHLAGR
jgi:protein TonB